MLAIDFPNFDPVLIQIGPFAVRWYALAYIGGLLLGWRYMVHLFRRNPTPPGLRPVEPRDVDDFLLWATIGVLIGGRLGHVLFFRFDYYLENPLQALHVWEGGMAFHGGLLGVIVATLLFCHNRRLHPLHFGDGLAVVAPIGLFFGRIANFINGELWGKASEVPWAMVFPDPRAGDVPRHPSQLYEAFLEGLVLFVILVWLAHRTRAFQRPGLLIGVFLAGYGVFRFLVEYVREGWVSILGVLTTGQALSALMVIAGAAFIANALRAPKPGD